MIEAPTNQNLQPLPAVERKPVILHKQPLLLYAMVVGRSGSNKSGALSAVMESFEEFQRKKNTYAQFESGTLEGLMKEMEDNHGSVIGVFDEFATF